MVSPNKTEIEIEIETTETNDKKHGKGDSSKRVQAQHPIELEYWFILPALRRSVAKTLKDKGLKQKEVAKILGVTEAGVSQYLKGSRGVLKDKSDKIIFFPDWLNKEVYQSCITILEDPTDRNSFLKEINRLLLVIRSRPTDFLCLLHSEYGIIDTENCDVCMKE